MKSVDIRRFVPKEIYTQYGAKSCWFVSKGIIQFVEEAEKLYLELLLPEYPDIESVELVINNWHEGGQFNNRGLRTFDYIASQIKKGVATTKLTQHLGGSTNAVDYNVRIKTKTKTFFLNSDKAHDLVTKNEKRFMDIGLTTLEDKSITKGWTHADLRYTGLNNLLIVKP